MKLLLAVVAALLVATGTASIAQAEVPGLQACLEQAAPPNGCSRPICFYDLAKGTGQGEAVALALEALIKERPNELRLRFEAVLIADLFGLEEVEQQYRDLAYEFETLGEYRCAHTCLTNLARVLRTSGRPGGARTILAKARLLGELSEESELLGRSLVAEAMLDLEEVRDVGATYDRIRQLVASQDLRKRCPISWVVAERKRVWSPTLCRNLFSALVSSAYNLGRRSTAWRYNEDRIRYLEAIDRPFDLARALLARATLLAASWKGDQERGAVIEAYRAAAEAGETARNPGVRQEANLELARLLPEPEKSRLMELAGAIVTDAASRRDFDISLAAESVHAAPEDAQRLMDSAWTELIHEGTPLKILHNWRDRLFVEWQTRPRDDAAATSLAFLDYFEAFRTSQQLNDTRADFFSNWTEAMSWLSGLLLTRYQDSGDRRDLDLAFDVSEWMRARLLQDLITKRTKGAGFEEEADQHKEVLGVEELAELRRRLLPGGSLSLEERLNDSATPAGEGLFAAPFALSTVEERVPREAALLSFQLDSWEDVYGSPDGGSWLLVTTSKSTLVYPLPDAHILEPWLGNLVSAFESSPTTATPPLQAPSMAAIFELLLARPLAELPDEVTQLVIVPDGNLHRFPFSVLGPDGGPTLNERFSLRISPSVRSWWDLRRTTPARLEASPLVLVDPTFTQEAEITATTRDKTLGRLPFAQKEAKAIRRHFLGTGTYLRRTEASESALVKRSAEPFSIVHLAAHAIAARGAGEDSYVLLAPGGEGGTDGLLRPDEIAALQLDGKLVVLAACQGSDGRLLSGEGTLSLARPFLAAGASAVVASLWPLDDRLAAAFYDAFYRHLTRGETVADALRQAQIDRSIAGDASIHWAGTQVIGNGDWLLPPLVDSRDALLECVAAAVVVVLLAGAALFRFRSRH